MHSCVLKFWRTQHFIAIIEACFTASRRANKIGPGGGTRTGGGRCGRRRFDRRTAPPSHPPPVTIAAAPVAQPIAGIRRALAHIGGLMEACGHESQIGWSAFLYFPGVRGGAGGRGRLVGARRMTKAQQSFRAVRIRVSAVNVVPFYFARDHGRDHGVGSVYTPLLPFPCAPLLVPISSPPCVCMFLLLFASANIGQTA